MYRKYFLFVFVVLVIFVYLYHSLFIFYFICVRCFQLNWRSIVASTNFFFFSSKLILRNFGLVIIFTQLHRSNKFFQLKIVDTVKN